MTKPSVFVRKMLLFFRIKISALNDTPKSIFKNSLAIGLR